MAYFANDGTFKKIGIDVDGVLANFSFAYMHLIIRLTGKNLFPETDWKNPSCWDWDLVAGYTKEERKLAFASIAESNSFNISLEPFHENVTPLRHNMKYLIDNHDVYFVTNRGGRTAKTQTEEWLRRYVAPRGNYGECTAIITGHRVKGLICRALQLDAYIDDNYDNVMDCMIESPTTNTYLLNKSYNAQPPEEDTTDRGEHLVRLYRDVRARIELNRVDSIEKFLERESLLPTVSSPA